MLETGENCAVWSLFKQQQRLKQMASGSPAASSNSNEPAVKTSASTLTSPTRPSDQLAASVSGSLHSSPLTDDLFSIAASQQTFGANASSHTAFNSTSTSLEPLFGTSSTAQTTFGLNATGDAAFGSNTFAPSFGANPALFAPAPVSNPFVAPPQPVMVLPPAAWASSIGSQGSLLIFYNVKMILHLKILLSELQCQTLISSTAYVYYCILLLLLLLTTNDGAITKLLLLLLLLSTFI